MGGETIGGPRPLQFTPGNPYMCPDDVITDDVTEYTSSSIITKLDTLVVKVESPKL